MKTSKALTIIQSVPPYTQHVLYYGSKFGSFKLFLSSVSWQNRKKNQKGGAKSSRVFFVCACELTMNCMSLSLLELDLGKKARGAGEKKQTNRQSTGSTRQQPINYTCGGGGASISIHRVYRNISTSSQIFKAVLSLHPLRWCMKSVCVCVCIKAQNQ